MRKRLQFKPKAKVTVSTRIRLVVIVSSFAVVVAVGFILYYQFGDVEDSIANQENVLPDFNYRKKLIYSKDIVKGNEVLLNFPVLIQLTDADLRAVNRGGKIIHPKGYDIRFTKADGKSVLPAQVESYNPNTGEVNVWVVFDTLSSKSNNLLYMYYSNAIIKNELANVLWSDNVKGVWHCNGDLNAKNNRKLKATTIGTSEVKGKIGAGRLFSSEAKNYASFDYSEDLDIKGDFTISAWIYLNEKGREQVIVSNQGDRPGGYRLLINKNNQLAVDIINTAGKRISNSGVEGAVKLEMNRWYFVAGVYNSSLNLLQTYVDGIFDKSLSLIDAPANSSASLQIGRNQFDEDSYFNGVLDEIKVTSAIRTQSWLATEFYNQFAPKSLFSLGAAVYLNMSAESRLRNKQAMGENDNQELKNQLKANKLQAKKFNGASGNPNAVSSSAEFIQARLNNINRVAKDNDKAQN
jgi:hypothetical protein